MPRRLSDLQIQGPERDLRIVSRELAFKARRHEQNGNQRTIFLLSERHYSITPSVGVFGITESGNMVEAWKSDTASYFLPLNLKVGLTHPLSLESRGQSHACIFEACLVRLRAPHETSKEGPAWCAPMRKQEVPGRVWGVALFLKFLRESRT